MPRLNAYYLLAIVAISCGSMPKGYDEGGFSASVGLPSFVNDYNLITSNWKNNPNGLADRKANITSFGVLGAAFGSFLCLGLTDRLGRIRSWQAFVLLWAAGMMVQIFSSGIYGLLLFARIFAGLGAGGLTVVTPLYLSEIAPAKSRGMVVSMYMVVLLSTLTVGFFINYAASVGLSATRTQYRLVQAIPLIPVGLAFISSFFIMDSPRWLISEDRTEEAKQSLFKLRGLSVDSEEHNTQVDREYKEILSQCQVKNDLLKNSTFWSIAKDMVVNPSYRKRFILAALVQTVGQWSGGNGITFYIPSIFQYAGVNGSNTSLITSGAYGVVKLVFTMVFAWGLVDIFGRRKCTLSGLFLQCITHIYMAIYMALWKGSSNKSASDAAIASVFIYAVGWSIGLCNTMSLYGTEIFPTKIRSVSYAVNMALHWFFQFAVVRVTPNMFVSLNVWGAYVFWAVICAVGWILLFLFAPETKGLPMEHMEELFAGKWYMGFKARQVLDRNHRHVLEQHRLSGMSSGDEKISVEVQEKV